MKSNTYPLLKAHSLIKVEAIPGGPCSPGAPCAGAAPISEAASGRVPPLPWRWRCDSEAGAARDWTWHRRTESKCEKTEDEFTLRSGPSGCASEVCTFASSEFSLSLRSVIRLQFRQSARKKGEKRRELVDNCVVVHTSVLLMQSQKEEHGHCSYWTGDLQRGQTGGAERTVSSPPPEPRAGFLHLQHNRNNCSDSAFRGLLVYAATKLSKLNQNEQHFLKSISFSVHVQ